MAKIIKITESQLKKLIDEQITETNDHDDGSYMVLSNLVMIKDYIDTILKYKHQSDFNSLITGEHAWAADHIATSKDDIQEVSNFIESYYNKDELSEEKMKGKSPCWKGYEMIGKKMKNGKEVPNCVPIKESSKIYEDEYGTVETTNFIVDDLLNEAEYQGRKVKLGKIMQGDVKKFKVYVKNDKGKVVKVNFGFGGKSAKGKVMKIKKNNPERRKSFRARHHCENPGPRWKPRYWSCKTW